MADSDAPDPTDRHRWTITEDELDPIAAEPSGQGKNRPDWPNTQLEVTVYCALE